jgi:hypothetical protein
MYQWQRSAKVKAASTPRTQRIPMSRSTPILCLSKRAVVPAGGRWRRNFHRRA